MVSMTLSILVPDSLLTLYLCFVKVQSHDVEIPEVGSRLKITLNIEPPTLAAALPSALLPGLSVVQQPVVETPEWRVS
jgi:hypothetical protein